MLLRVTKSNKAQAKVCCSSNIYFDGKATKTLII